MERIIDVINEVALIDQMRFIRDSFGFIRIEAKLRTPVDSKSFKKALLEKLQKWRFSTSHQHVSGETENRINISAKLQNFSFDIEFPENPLISFECK